MVQPVMALVWPEFADSCQKQVHVYPPGTRLTRACGDPANWAAKCTRPGTRLPRACTDPRNSAATCAGRVDSGLTCTGDRRQALGNHPNGHTLTRWQREAREGALEVEPVRVPHSCAGRHLPHKRYPADTREEALRLLRLGRRSGEVARSLGRARPRGPGPAPASSTGSGSR